MKDRTLVTLVLVLTVLFLTGMFILGQHWKHQRLQDESGTIPPVEYHDSLTCQEDMPCWDCHTMGNEVCGHG